MKVSNIPELTQANSVKRTLDDARMSFADLELVPPNQILSFSHRLYIFQKPPTELSPILWEVLDLPLDVF